jgi:hypothetical protein
VRRIRASVFWDLLGEHAGDGMFYIANLCGLRTRPKWFDDLHCPGVVRRELQLRVSKERLRVRLFVDVLLRMPIVRPDKPAWVVLAAEVAGRAMLSLCADIVHHPREDRHVFWQHVHLCHSAVNVGLSNRRIVCGRTMSWFIATFW